MTPSILASLPAAPLPLPGFARRAATAALTAALAAGCADLGERASSGDCPAASCDPETPEGLAFASAGLGGSGGGVLPVALGGRLDLRLLDAATDRDLARPYRASTTGPLAILEQRGNVVSLRGAFAGDDVLRIADPASEALLDQIGVRALPLEAAGLEPSLLFQLGLIYLPDAPRRPVAVLAGRPAPLTLQLLAAGGTRILDEDLVVAAAPSTSPATVVKGRSWDLIELTAQAAGPLDLEVRAGGRTLALRLPVVAEPEALEAGTSATPVRVGDSASVCFNAVASGRNVVGVDWSFTATGATGQRFFDTGCFTTDPLPAAGPVSVTASSGTRTLTFSFTVLPAARPAAVAAPAAAAPTARAAAPPSLGERAAAYSSSPVQ